LTTTVKQLQPIHLRQIFTILIIFGFFSSFSKPEGFKTLTIYLNFKELTETIIVDKESKHLFSNSF